MEIKIKRRPEPERLNNAIQQMIQAMIGIGLLAKDHEDKPDYQELFDISNQLGKLVDKADKILFKWL